MIDKKQDHLPHPISCIKRHQFAVLSILLNQNLIFKDV